MCAIRNEIILFSFAQYLFWFYSDPVTIQRISGIKNTDEGTQIELTCESAGNPIPQYNWSYTANNSVIQQTKVLTLTNANCVDSGEYRCNAQNSLGQDTMVENIFVKCNVKCFIN